MPEVQTLSAITALGDLLQGVGALVVLLWVLVLFIRGDLVTGKTVDKLLEEANNRTAKLVSEVKEGIKEAVKEGILEARQEWTDQAIVLNRRIDDIPCVRGEVTDARKTDKELGQVSRPS